MGVRFRRLPAWLTQALAQAERAARAGQLAIVVLHPHGTPHAEDLVLIRLRDFERLLEVCDAPTLLDIRSEESPPGR